MGVLAPFVADAQPALFGGGVNAQATAGASWSFTVSLTNPDGTSPDLSAVTGTCKVISAVGGSTLATLTYAGATGSFTVTLDESLSAGLASGSEVKAKWLMTLSDGTDVVQVWGPSHSNFQIQPAA